MDNFNLNIINLEFCLFLIKFIYYYKYNIKNINVVFYFLEFKK